MYTARHLSEHAKLSRAQIRSHRTRTLESLSYSIPASTWKTPKTLTREFSLEKRDFQTQPRGIPGPGNFHLAPRCTPRERDRERAEIGRNERRANSRGCVTRALKYSAGVIRGARGELAALHSRSASSIGWGIRRLPKRGDVIAAGASGLVLSVARVRVIIGAYDSWILGPRESFAMFISEMRYQPGRMENLRRSETYELRKIV